MANRQLLHRSHLETFKSWVIAQGYNVEACKGDGYEVLRFRVPAIKEPIIIYDRNEGDHFTTFGKGDGIVRRFIRGKKQLEKSVLNPASDEFDPVATGKHLTERINSFTNPAGLICYWAAGMNKLRLAAMPEKWRHELTRRYEDRLETINANGPDYF